MRERIEHWNQRKEFEFTSSKVYPGTGDMISKLTVLSACGLKFCYQTVRVFSLATFEDHLMV